MPKLTDTDQRSVDAMEEEMAETSDSIETAATRRIAAQLDGPLVIHVRIKNSRVDYAFGNRPDPTLSRITDAVLMTALIKAGRSYPIGRLGKKSRKTAYGQREKGEYAKLAFKERICIDFGEGSIQSTLKKATVLPVLSIVVQNLAASAAKEAPPPEAPN